MDMKEAIRTLTTDCEGMARKKPPTSQLGAFLLRARRAAGVLLSEYAKAKEAADGHKAVAEEATRRAEAAEAQLKKATEKKSTRKGSRKSDKDE